MQEHQTSQLHFVNTNLAVVDTQYPVVKGKILMRVLPSTIERSSSNDKSELTSPLDSQVSKKVSARNASFIVNSTPFSFSHSPLRPPSPFMWFEDLWFRATADAFHGTEE
jgi:hypothetical protein